MSKRTQDKMAAEVAALADSTSMKPLKKRHRTEPSTPGPSALNDDDKYSDESSFEDDGFDEFLMGDDEDQRKLMSLPELDRERILFERQEKRRDILERNNLRRANREERRRALGRSTENEEPARKKTKTSQRAALDDLKKKRSKKEKRDEIYDDEDESVEEEDVKRTKTAKKLYGDDEDDLDFMDVEKPETPAKQKAKEPKEPKMLAEPAPKVDRMDVEEATKLMEEFAPLEDFSKIVITRTQVEKWFGEPYWNDVIRGLYCKVSVGVNPSLAAEDKNIYRIAEIVDLQESNKIYKLAQKECNVFAVLSLQGRTKNFEFKFFSNRPITSEEYDFFKKAQVKSRQNVVTLEEAEGIYERQVSKAENYHYTEEDVNKVVQRNLAKAKDPIHFTKDKTRLREEIEESKAEGNEARVHELQARLDEILKKEEQIRKTAELGRHVKVSELNLNRRANYFKQQDEEREQTLQRERDELEGRVSIDDDPFARRKTYGGDFKKTEVAPVTSGASANDAQATSSIAVQKGGGVGLDLDELEVPEATSVFPLKLNPPAPTVPSAASSANPNKKAISLEEYKRKKMMLH